MKGAQLTTLINKTRKQESKGRSPVSICNNTNLLLKFFMFVHLQQQLESGRARITDVNFFTKNTIREGKPTKYANKGQRF